MSVAPGFMLGNVIVMAGIPRIMHVMLDAATKFLKTGKKMLSTALDLHRPEGEIAEMFANLQKRYPDVPMGSYPSSATASPAPARPALARPARLAEAETELKASSPPRLAVNSSRISEGRAGICRSAHGTRYGYVNKAA